MINLERKRNGFPEANILLMRDAGNKLPILPRKEGWATISPLPLEKGISRLAGIDILPFEYPPCEEKCESYNYFYNHGSSYFPHQTSLEVQSLTGQVY